MELGTRVSDTSDIEVMKESLTTALEGIKDLMLDGKCNVFIIESEAST